MTAMGGGLSLTWPPCYIDQAKEMSGEGKEKSVFPSHSTTPISPDENTISFPGFLFFVPKKRDPVNEVDYIKQRCDSVR